MSLTRLFFPQCWQRNGHKRLLSLLFVLLVTSHQPHIANGKKQKTLPRIVSLRALKAYVRTGPGKMYPTRWLLTAPGLPLCVHDVFEMWYQIEDPLGTKGWMHKSLLSGKPTAYLTKTLPLVRKPHANAPTVAFIQKGAFLTVLGASAQWFLVKSQNLTGYIPRHLCWRGLDAIYNLK